MDVTRARRMVERRVDLWAVSMAVPLAHRLVDQMVVQRVDS